MTSGSGIRDRRKILYFNTIFLYFRINNTYLRCVTWQKNIQYYSRFWQSVRLILQEIITWLLTSFALIGNVLIEKDHFSRWASWGHFIKIAYQTTVSSESESTRGSFLRPDPVEDTGDSRTLETHSWAICNEGPNKVPPWDFGTKRDEGKPDGIAFPTSEMPSFSKIRSSSEKPFS